MPHWESVSVLSAIQSDVSPPVKLSLVMFNNTTRVERVVAPMLCAPSNCHFASRSTILTDSPNLDPNTQNFVPSCWYDTCRETLNAEQNSVRSGSVALH